jgi:hypothetical protein
MKKLTVTVNVNTTKTQEEVLEEVRRALKTFGIVKGYEIEVTQVKSRKR